MAVKRCPSCESRYRDGAAHCPFDGAALVALDDPLIGRLIGGRYSIEARLGVGGMGTVYRGRHQALDREVALKILHPKLAAQDEHRQRFLREARAANRVQHANVVDIVDIGETEDGIVYLVMEYLRGSTLAAEIDKGALPLARACSIGHQIARPLARAHVLGVIHRDVKPDNVFLLQRGVDADVVKLLDFGLARSLDDAALTKSNSIFGTPGYMAPEQIEGGPVGPAADLYALGCVLYEMLTGVLPFDGTVPALFYQHVHAVAPRLRERRPELPPSLDALVAKLLEKSPARRPASAYQVADALTTLLGSTPPRPDALAATASDPAPAAQKKSSTQAEDRHLEQLRNRAVAAHADKTLPLWLNQTLARMDVLVEQVRAGRDQLAERARAATFGAARSRETALSIGQALDALATHDLALAARLATAEQELDRASRALHPHTRALLSASEQLDAAPSVRAGLQDRGLPSFVRDWARAQRAVLEIEAQCEALKRERDDLGFQMSQLKGRMGAFDATSSAENLESANHDSTLDSEVRAKIYALRLEADRVAEHLAERKRAHG